jgi:hypothetical protein
VGVLLKFLGVQIIDEGDEGGERGKDGWKEVPLPVKFVHLSA